MNFLTTSSMVLFSFFTTWSRVMSAGGSRIQRMMQVGMVSCSSAQNWGILVATSVAAGMAHPCSADGSSQFSAI